jgi:hypothetical protein
VREQREVPQDLVQLWSQCPQRCHRGGLGHAAPVHVHVHEYVVGEVHHDWTYPEPSER